MLLILVKKAERLENVSNVFSGGVTKPFKKLAVIMLNAPQINPVVIGSFFLAKNSIPNIAKLLKPTAIEDGSKLKDAAPNISADINIMNPAHHFFS